jgi:hypothetical protein
MQYHRKSVRQALTAIPHHPRPNRGDPWTSARTAERELNARRTREMVSGAIIAMVQYESYLFSYLFDSRGFLSIFA